MKKRKLPIFEALRDFTGLPGDQPRLTVFVFLAGVFSVEILATYLGEWLQDRIPNVIGLPSRLAIPLIALGTVVVLYSIVDRILHERKRRDIGFDIVLAPPNPRPGLIMLISTYHPPSKSGLTQERVAELVAQLQSEDNELIKNALDGLVVEKSNLRPQLEAIRYHAKDHTLRDAWLVSTKPEVNENGQIIDEGSIEAVAIIKAYVSHFLPEIKARIHGGESYTVSVKDYGTIFRIVDQIYEEAPYKSTEIIADITGGTKVMSLGVALACLAPERLMQYMSSDRDWKGDPIPEGMMQPVLLDVDAFLSLKQEEPGD